MIVRIYESKCKKRIIVVFMFFLLIKCYRFVKMDVFRRTIVRIKTRYTKQNRREPTSEERDLD